MNDACTINVLYEYKRHLQSHQNEWGVIHDLNIFIINATVFMINEVEEEVL